jgi:hypothetical protein
MTAAETNTEETPLLENQHNAIYDRFPPQKKKVIVAIISWIGLLPLFVSGMLSNTRDMIGI